MLVLKELGRVSPARLDDLAPVQRVKNCTSGTVRRILIGGSWYGAFDMSRSSRLGMRGRLHAFVASR
jgi:hypothetical protein